jgi:branched-chain amino acid transport system ATP-binding protein
VLKPDSGKVSFKNEEITGLPPHKICRKGVTRSFQVVSVFQRQTVLENVQVAVLTRRKETRSLFTSAERLYIDETKGILDSVGLASRADRVVGSLSHGDRKVLEIAMALGGNPEFLILDEPTAGMSPDETSRCVELIKRLQGELGLTILFCEHDMDLVSSISNRIMVMVRGMSIIQGTCDEVRCDKAVQDAYLGGGEDSCLM